MTETLKEKYVRVKAELEEALAAKKEMEATIEGFDHKLAKLKDKIYRLQDEVDQKNLYIADLEETIDSQAKQLSEQGHPENVTGRSDGEREMTEAAGKKLEQNVHESDRAKEIEEELQRVIDDMTDEGILQQEHIDELSEQIEERDSIIDGLRQQIETLEAHIADLKGNNCQGQDPFTRGNTTTGSEQRIEQLLAERQLLVERIEGLEAYIADNERAYPVEDIEGVSPRSANSALRILKTQYLRLSREHTTLTKEKTQLQEENDLLRSEIRKNFMSDDESQYSHSNEDECDFRNWTENSEPNFRNPAVLQDATNQTARSAENMNQVQVKISEIDNGTIVVGDHLNQMPNRNSGIGNTLENKPTMAAVEPSPGFAEPNNALEKRDRVSVLVREEVVDKMKMEHQQKISEHQKIIDELHTQLDTCKEEIENLSKLNEALSQENENIPEYNRVIQMTKNTNMDLENKIKTLNKSLETITTEKMTLKQKVEGLQKQLQEGREPGPSGIVPLSPPRTLDGSPPGTLDGPALPVKLKVTELVKFHEKLLEEKEDFGVAKGKRILLTRSDESKSNGSGGVLPPWPSMDRTRATGSDADLGIRKDRVQSSPELNAQVSMPRIFPFEMPLSCHFFSRFIPNVKKNVSEGETAKVRRINWFHNDQVAYCFLGSFADSQTCSCTERHQIRRVVLSVRVPGEL